MTRFLLGIDGGGTKTQAVIVDEHGRFHGTGLGGPSNYDDVGVVATQASMAQAVTCRAAGG
jgi:N-acetylglucosamine kinase-like BadF-type ATPase